MPNYRNICESELPISVNIGNREVFINAGFRCMWEFERIVSDKNSPDEAKKYSSLKLFYGSDMPSDELKATDEMLLFYKQYKAEKRRNTRRKHSNEILCDFNHDADYIYADFLREYHIDLNKTNLHWFKFNALFSGLSPQSKIVTIIGYRGMNLAEIKDAKLRENYREIKEQYEIGKIMQVEITDRDKEIARILATTGDLSEYLAAENIRVCTNEK